MSGKQPLISDDQMKEFCEAFNYFARGTDRIDRIDLKIIFESLRSLEKLPDDEFQYFCDLVDKDGKGITHQPFLQLMEQQVKQDPLVNLRKAFDAIDKDGNGNLDHEELKEAVELIMPGQFTDDNLDSMINSVDLDGDGELSFPEFVKMMQELSADEFGF